MADNDNDNDNDFEFGNDFSQGNKNPQFHLKDRKGRFFLSPEKTTRSNIAQGHHANPTNVVNRTLDPRLAPNSVWNIGVRLFDGLKQYAGYRQNDIDRNRIWLPTSEDDAMRLGASRHYTSHPEYDKFMSGKYAEIGRHAEERIRGINYPPGTDYDDAVRRIYQDADKDMAGLQRWVKWALQATDAQGRPILSLNDGDIRLQPGETAADVNNRASQNYKIYNDDLSDGSLKNDHFFNKGFNGDLSPDGHALKNSGDTILIRRKNSGDTILIRCKFAKAILDCTEPPILGHFSPGKGDRRIASTSAPFFFLFASA